MNALWYNLRNFRSLDEVWEEPETYFLFWWKIFPYIFQPWCIASLQYSLKKLHSFFLCLVLFWFSHHFLWNHVKHLHIFFKVASLVMEQSRDLPCASEISLKDMCNIDLGYRTITQASIHHRATISLNSFLFKHFSQKCVNYVLVGLLMERNDIKWKIY